MTSGTTDVADGQAMKPLKDNKELMGTYILRQSSNVGTNAKSKTASADFPYWEKCAKLLKLLVSYKQAK